MGSKVLFVLVMFMAAILLISAAPNEYQNFHKKNGEPAPNGVYDSKWGYGGWGGPWYGGWGGPYYGGGWGGPWRGGGWGWRGGWGGWRPNEHVEAGINANPHN